MRKPITILLFVLLLVLVLVVLMMGSTIRYQERFC